MLTTDTQPSDYPISFGRYSLLEQLGKGASGQVFLAELQGAAGFRKRVALKIMRQNFSGDKADFVREGRLCGLLNHRNVIDTYEFGVLDNQAFIAMEFIDGMTLSILCQLGALPPSLVLEVGLNICRGLGYAHELQGAEGPFGLVHRDIKPSNILIGWDGSVKVADFGIAVLTGSDNPPVQSWWGSPGYMSPEQWNHQPLDARSDVFSLCVVLYEMCTGQRLIQGADIDARRKATLDIDALVHKTDCLPHVHGIIAGLDQVIARGLTRDPAHRFGQAEVLSKQLREIQRDVGREPSLEDWLASTLDKREKTWGHLNPVGAQTVPDVPSIISEPTIEMPLPVKDQNAVAAALQKLQCSSALEDVLDTLQLIERALAGVATHQRIMQLELVHRGLAQAGLQLVRPGAFPYLVTDRRTGRYWFQGAESIKFRPNSLSERFLYTVATKGPDLSRIALYEYVWEQPYMPPSSDSVLRVRAHRVRTAIAPVGMTVERYGDGQYVLAGMPGVLSWQPEPAMDETPSAGKTRRPSQRLTNVERPPNTFFGRTHEMGELTRLFHERQTVVTVLGPPGTGKTRMTKEWAHFQLEEGAVQSAWFCDLSSSHSTRGILDAVANSLGIPLTGGDQAEEKLVEHLGNAIAGRGRTLLILDNAEQVSKQVCDVLKQWWSTAKQAHFVVTSRVPLGLKMEQRFRLEPLALPEAHRSSTSLATNAAVALFVERARTVQPAFSVGDHNAAIVAAIVTKLDGLPLAIELAAARSFVLSPSQLLDRLSERFKLLQGGGSPRQKTLEGAIRWSWDLLEPWEQAAMAQLSVFQDGFFMEAAEAVLDLSAWPEAPWSLDVVGSLLDKSLIHSRNVLDVPRFSMYLSIQAYAAQKLRTDRSPTQEATPLMEARRRHAAYFAQLGTEKHLASIRIRGGVARQRRLRCELENLLVGARMALAGKSGEVAANCAIAAAETGMARGAAEGLLGRVLDEVEMEAPKTARLLNARGWLLNQLGKNDEALEQLQQALAIHRESGNRQGEGYVVSLMAVVYRHQGRIDEAVAANQQALALHRETGNRRGEGIIVGNLAILYGDQGRIDEALEANQQALVLIREVSNRWGEAIIHGNIGDLLFETGDLEASEDHIQQAMAIGAESDFSQTGAFLGSLAMIRAHEGAFDEARTLLGTGEDQLRGTSALELSRLLCKRARMEILAGDLGAATDALDKAQVVGSDIGRGPSSKLTEDIAEIRQILDTKMASED